MAKSVNALLIVFGLAPYRRESSRSPGSLPVSSPASIACAQPLPDALILVTQSTRCSLSMLDCLVIGVDLLFARRGWIAYGAIGDKTHRTLRRVREPNPALGSYAEFQRQRPSF